MMEFRRIFGRWSLWVLVALAVCCNAFLFYQTQEKEYETISAAYDVTTLEFLGEYERQLTEYEGMTGAEALAHCQEIIDRDKAAMHWGLDTYIREYRVKPFLEHMKEYPEYLKQVQANADRLGGFSIFTNKSAFSSRNIKITAEDFARVLGTEPALGNYYGVKALMDYRIADYMILLLMLAVFWQMLAERKKGLWGIVRLTGGGRCKLALKRLGIVVFGGLVFSVLLYASTLVMDWRYFGVIDLSVPAQSLPELAKLPVVMTMGEFLGQYLLVKIFGTMLLALFLWVILSAVTNTAAAMAVAGIAVAGEYALFAFLPVQSIFNIVKYCNLFSYFYLDQLYIKYLNMNLFGYPVNNRELLLAMLPVLLLLSCGAVVWINTKKRPEERRGFFARVYEWIKKKTDRITCSLGGFGMEVYKTMIVQKGWVFLILLCWLMCQIYPVIGGKVEVGKTMVEYYLEDWEGPIDDPETHRKMEEVWQEIQAEYAEYDQLVADFEAGKADEMDVIIAGSLLDATRNREAGYNEVQQRIEEMKWRQEELGITPWLLNYRWVLNLFEDTDAQRVNGLAGMLAMILLISPLYAYENQTGAGSVIRGSGKGRGKVVVRKQLLTVLAVALVWGIVYGTHLWSVVRYYGIRALDAPIQSVKWFYYSDWLITLKEMLILIYGLRFVVLWAVAQVLLLLSSLAKKVQLSILLGVFLVLLPSALWGIGVEALSFVSLLRPLSTVEVMWEENFMGYGYLVPFVITGAVGVAASAITSVRWVKTI